MESVFQGFLESQQANALSVQSVPSLLSFTGEDVEAEAKHWLDRFEERATMLSWTDELKCYHIKQYLAGTALQVLPPAKRSNYGQLIEALKDRFKPIDIEELRGLEFLQLTQKNQSVEKFGLELMTLGKKALETTELDNLLKGRFFQALLPKWQRKLGAPRLGESFNALYERARTTEQQYQSSWEPRDSSEKQQGEKGEPPQKRQSTLKCFGCGGLGHFKRNCPQSASQTESKSKQDRSEANSRDPLPQLSKPSDFIR